MISRDEEKREKEEKKKIVYFKMVLFEVEGWDLKQKDVAFGGAPEKKKEKAKEKKEKLKEKKAKAKENKSKDNSKRSRDEGSRDEDHDKSKKKSKTNKNQNNVKPEEETGKQEEKVTPIKEEEPITPMTKLTPLQQKMMAKLSGSRFRWINEQLYTIDSESALKLMKEQPSLFDEYHQGFRSQVQSWPENPVDVFVNQVKTRTKKPVNAPGGLPGLPDKTVVVADMGCGEAQFALDVSNFLKLQNKKKGNKKNMNIQVNSFDLKKVNDRITVADIKNVPLEDGSCTIVIFCLALMGTNFLDFIQEAYRILAPRGELWIAEIKSRFSENEKNGKEVGEELVKAIKANGFFHKNTDNENKMFTKFEFFKPPQDVINERKRKLQNKKRFIEEASETEAIQLKRQEKPEGEWLLKPCIYKRR